MKTNLLNGSGLLLPLVLLMAFPRSVSAQAPGRYTFELGVGLHAFYLPGIGAHWANPQPVFMLGAYRSLDRRHVLQAGFTIGYQRNKFQGDGLFAQAQFRYNPVIFKHFEPGIGIGAGYQLAFYPSPPLNWDGANWVRGKAFKGVVQAPLRLSLGYRVGQYTPFVAYQVNMLFGYSPDLNPLPVSALLAGIKFSPR